MTTHHVISGCIRTVSTAGKDYVTTGFYAATKVDELKCPGFSASVLQGMEDVTSRVKTSIPRGTPPHETAKAEEAVTSTISEECGRTTKLSCEVVSFYSGAAYFLFRYKTYNDLRLVFAPEHSIAFFGGDLDNFEYPRYDLDIAFLRIYEDNKPIQTENFFAWSANGARENELVFVPGFPGESSRFDTVAHLEFLRDVIYPLQAARQARAVEIILKRSTASEEARRKMEQGLFHAQNNLKVTKAYLSGLMDKDLMAGRIEQEDRLRRVVLSDPKLKAEFGNPWEVITDYYDTLRGDNLFLERFFFPDPLPIRPGSAGGLPGVLPALARLLVLSANEKTEPENLRDPALTDQFVEKRLFTRSRDSKATDIDLLSHSLAQMAKFLKDSPIAAKLLQGKAPEQVAREWIENTKVGDIEFRKQLYQGGKDAVEKCTDPLVVAVRLQVNEALRVKREWDEKVAPEEQLVSIAKANVAQAHFAVEGFASAPDANSTLRLSYGTVKGYVEDGRGKEPRGTKLAPFTTLGQTYQCATQHGNEDPYVPPESWRKAKDKANRKVPLNLVSTDDIVFGNSGSPLINKNAQVVGLVFDGNVQMLVSRFQFIESTNRAIAVDSRGILEALRSIYGAYALADELVGKTSVGTAKRYMRGPTMQSVLPASTRHAESAQGHR